MTSTSLILSIFKQYYKTHDMPMGLLGEVVSYANEREKEIDKLKDKLYRMTDKYLETIDKVNPKK